MGKTYEEQGDRLSQKLEARSEAYGEQYSDFKTEHLVGKINELIANFVDGSGNLTVKDIEQRIIAAFPANKRVHKSRL